MFYIGCQCCMTNPDVQTEYQCCWTNPDVHTGCSVVTCKTDPDVQTGCNVL